MLQEQQDWYRRELAVVQFLLLSYDASRGQNEPVLARSSFHLARTKFDSPHDHGRSLLRARLGSLSPTFRENYKASVIAGHAFRQCMAGKNIQGGPKK